MTVASEVALNVSMDSTNTDLLAAVTWAFDKISILRDETVVEGDYDNCDDAAIDLATNRLINKLLLNRQLSGEQVQGYSKIIELTPEIKNMIFRDLPKIVINSSPTALENRTKNIFDAETE